MSLGVKKKYNHTNKKIYIKYVKYLYLFLNYKKNPNSIVFQFTNQNLA